MTFFFLRNRNQHMLGAEVFVFELRRFSLRLIEYLIQTRGHIRLVDAHALDAGLLFQMMSEFLFNLLGRSVQFIDDGAGDAFFLPQETNKKMFRFDGLMTKRTAKRLRFLD